MANVCVGMMTFSFNRSISAGEIDVPGIVRYCADLGLDAIELTERHWANPGEDIPATVDALQETGLTVACCNTGLDLITRGAEAKAEREAQLRTTFERLAKVECKAVMLGSTQGDLTPEEWRKEFGIGLGESVPIAADHGLTVTFENRGGAAGQYVGTVEHCEEILRYSEEPRLKLTFDVGNFRYVSVDHNGAYERLADTIAHVHLKDVVPRNDSFGMVPLGEGEVDNAPVIKKLAERGYPGCLSIECGGVNSDREDARRSAEYVKRVLAEA